MANVTWPAAELTGRHVPLSFPTAESFILFSFCGEGVVFKVLTFAIPHDRS